MIFIFRNNDIAVNGAVTLAENIEKLLNLTNLNLNLS